MMVRIAMLSLNYTKLSLDAQLFFPAAFSEPEETVA
jgi:hypothetical protein